MESKQVLSKLNQARRALDALSQVEIIDEWEFDKELNVWHLHLGITVLQLIMKQSIFRRYLNGILLLPPIIQKEVLKYILMLKTA